jgi:hypothetical protein
MKCLIFTLRTKLADDSASPQKPDFSSPNALLQSLFKALQLNVILTSIKKKADVLHLFWIKTESSYAD